MFQANLYKYLFTQTVFQNAVTSQIVNFLNNNWSGGTMNSQNYNYWQYGRGSGLIVVYTADLLQMCTILHVNLQFWYALTSHALPKGYEDGYATQVGWCTLRCVYVSSGLHVYNVWPFLYIAAPCTMKKYPYEYNLTTQHYRAITLILFLTLG